MFANRRSSIFITILLLFTCTGLFLFTRYEINYVISERNNPSKILLNNQKTVLTVECKTYKTESNQHHNESTTIPINTTVQENKPSPKVLCWIMTNPKNHDTKAKAVNLTWGKRCDKIIFMSSKKDDNLGAVALPVGEGRQNLWAKTKEALKYLHEHSLNQFDWFLKADDDTYVIMENLKYFLQSKNPQDPIHFGCKLKKETITEGFMSGGAGYVLSKAALKLFVERALEDEHLCYRGNDGPEDVELGKCLRNVNVTAGDSRDISGKGTFFPMAPENHLIPEPPSSWYWSHIFYPTTDGWDTLSDRPISFHYINEKRMYSLEYLLYKVKLGA